MKSKLNLLCDHDISKLQYTRKVGTYVDLNETNPNKKK